MTARPAPHLFVPDPDVPADPYTGRRTCRCGLAEIPGDPRHTLPDPPGEADVRQRAAGEG